MIFAQWEGIANAFRSKWRHCQFLQVKMKALPMPSGQDEGTANFPYQILLVIFHMQYRNADVCWQSASKNADVILEWSHTGCGSHFRNPAFFRIVKSTKTNWTSEEKSDTQIFRNIMFKGVALSGGTTPTCSTKKPFFAPCTPMLFGQVDMEPS